MSNLSPFDFINSISLNKKDLFRENETMTFEEVEKAYTPFMVNRGLSYFPDTVLHANEMNIYPDLLKEAQYRYYLGAIRPGKRFSKWHKATKNTDVIMIQEMYSCNKRIAESYLKLMSAEQLEELKKSREIGGLTGKK